MNSCLTAKPFLVASAILLGALASANAQTVPGKYALILTDDSVAQRFPSKESMRSTQAVDYQRQIEAKQRALRTELAARKVRVTGSVSTVMNAVFVLAPKERVPELKQLPGVKAVVPMRRYQMKLNHATDILNAPAAWAALGGKGNAGLGIKIGILDTGIDQTHPAFQDSSLPMPPGYPICSGSDCAFTSNKVIVARSYVRQLAAGTGADPAVDSRPDDFSPRDHSGHGTAVASCAAANTNSGAFTFSGMAPKAYLGNYKIYGTPGLNDGVTDDVIISAIEDAVHDGMDVISFSSGGPAFSGPLDTGTACGNDPGVPCDLVAQTFETVAQHGVVVVAAAGNEGQDGTNLNVPTYSSISTPANAPSVIAVGATTNTHTFTEVFTVPGNDVPANLKTLNIQTGDAFVPTGAVTGTLRDVTQVGDNGLGCSAFPIGSLVGTIAIIQRGTCDFATKVSNAEDAGAIGVIFYMADASTPIPPGGLSGYPTPAGMISNADGLALKAFADANPTRVATFDPAGQEQNGQPNVVAGFSSLGPTIADLLSKPDVLAVGTSLYMAGERIDPAGELYSANGYVVADGTSFATPIVAGAAALLKQKHPQYTTLQVKSAIANTATTTITTDDTGATVDVRSTGAGQLDTGAAVASTLTAVPSSLAFIAGSATSKQIQLTNTGTSAANLTLAVSAAGSSNAATIAVDKQSISLQPGTSATVNATISGNLTSSGVYSGSIIVSGASGGTIHIPYLYVVASGTAADLIPVAGSFSDGIAGGGIAVGAIGIRLTDSTGLPIKGAPVTFRARDGGSIRQADATTDAFGIALAEPILGPTAGIYTYTASAGGLRTTFTEFARDQPSISADKVVSAAALTPDGAVVPGSYITILGSGLSDFMDYAESSTLPLQLDMAHVTFDVPSAGISVPGRLLFASPNQINLQVPWELQGQTSVEMKVSISYSDGNVITLPVSAATPALFMGVAGMAAALDGNYGVVTTSNPVAQGQVLQLFANGLGPVTHQPASGEPATATNLSETVTQAVVTIGNKPAKVLFSGLAPGFAGLYQINVIVPTGLASGPQPVTVSIGDRTSKSLNVPIK